MKLVIGVTVTLPALLVARAWKLCSPGGSSPVL